MVKNIGLIFPGQGAQKVGMGREFYQSSPIAKNIFDLADKICANNLLKVMFDGPGEELTKTSYCQPAIMAMSIAAYKVLEAHPKFNLLDIKFAAGLSLGEYTALAASNSLGFEDALRLVLKRGALMDEACTRNKGAMAAVLSFDKDQLVTIAKQAGVDVANFNSPEQIVISGHEERIQKAIELIKAAGGQKVIPLSVAGAFHSSLMQSAADQFKSHLSKVTFHPTRIEVITNVNALPQLTDAQIKENLAHQITASVQWVKTIEYMASHQVMELIEIGPGKVLKGLVRRINPNIVVHNIEVPADVDAFFATCA